jgi:hypothetical protein
MAVAIGLTGVCGCGRAKSNGDGEAAAISRTARQGPVEITLSVRPGEPKLDEGGELTLEILAEKSVTVQDYEYADALATGDHRFEHRVVRSDRHVAQPTDDGRLRWIYRYDLEFFLPGEHELPPAEVSFVQLEAGGTGAGAPQAADADEVQTVATEPLTFIVTAPEGEAVSQDELRTVTRLDPIDLPVPWYRSWLPGALAVILVVALGVAVWLLTRRRRQARSAIPVPAHEWARRQIAGLIADDLIGKGLVQEFHYRISFIVRGYIERRFGTAAPEMTTEEFLLAAVADARFGPEITEELKRFLTACDLVKYACHRPAQGACEAALKTAGTFVERTRCDTSPDTEQDAVPSPAQEATA